MGRGVTVVVAMRFRSVAVDLLSVSPLFMDTGTGLSVAPLGRTLRGSSFAFDPFAAYRDGLINGPNVAILGRIGYGKSASVKMIIRRSFDQRCGVVVLDPKGEYAELARTLDGEVVSFGSDGWLRIDTGSVRQDVDNIVALLESARGCALSDLDRMKLEAHWKDSDAGATSRPLLTLLQRCSEARDDELVATLSRFVDGDLGGLADGPEEHHLTLRRVTVIDLQKWWGTPAMPVVMHLAWTAAQRVAERSMTRRYVILDEAWALLDNPFALHRVRGSFKLARANGVSHFVVLHRLADLDSLGDAGSRTFAAAKSLVRDCDTHVIFNSAPGDVAAMQYELGLTDREAEYVGGIGRGEALVRFGAHRSVVRFEPTDLDAIDTDQAMR